MSITIALAGNPNTGKTTLFNALTGSNQFVGNWPGVTVEKKEGRLKGHDDVIITDLPGIYSLSPYTLEEVVARNYLVNEQPDAVLNIIDGTNLERNLYLTTQLMELGIPVVCAVNMMDVVKKNGDKIHLSQLEAELGCTFVKISALKLRGIEEAAQKAVEAVRTGKPAPSPKRFSDDVEEAVTKIQEIAVGDNVPEKHRRWYAVKIFERDERVMTLPGVNKSRMGEVEKIIKDCEEKLDDDCESIITNERYTYIESIIKFCYKRKHTGETVSDKIDRVVTGRLTGLPIFAAVMVLIYYISVTTIGSYATDWTNDGLFGKGFHLFGIESIRVPGIPVLIERGLDSLNTAGWLKGLVLDGIVGGVGSVLGFLPQMLMLFIFLAILEACGYMARVAFIMDRIFRKFGLSGKSFIPILIGTGCGVPGIMASRTIENESDRRMTVVTTTFIPCGAKLPVISMIAAELFRGAWWIGPSAYFMGMAAIIISGIMLKKTKMFAGEATPFVMELPPYHAPTPKNVLRSMWERGWSFIKKAGTVILLASIAVWAGSVFGWENGSFGFNADMELADSILGKIGSGIKLIFAPLGFGSSAASVATIMGLLAKEQIVGVFGVLGMDEFSRLSGYSFLAFNLLCAPCAAAMGAIRREMNSPKWTFFAIGYQCAFAYMVSLSIYQIGLLVTGNVNIPGFVFAVFLMGLVVYQLVRPVKKGI